MKAVGYDGDPAQHAVVEEAFGQIGGAGTPAGDVEKMLSAARYGWPRDAIMAAIGILLDSGLIRARINGSEATTRQVLAQTRLGGVQLRRESTVLKAAEKIAARNLLNMLGVKADNDTVVAASEEAVDGLAQRAADIAGPAPLPELPLPAAIATVRNATGNDRVHALLAAKDDLVAFSERLDTLQRRRPTRLAALETARGLQRASAGLDAAQQARARLEAFEQTRELLADHDQISPILTDLAQQVRQAVSGAATAVAEARQRAVDGLRSSRPGPP